MSSESTVHVIGAGLAGLSTAHALASAGRRVILSEAAGFAGGRCRAWDDAALGTRVDNGTHMVVGGNRTVFAWLAAIGATDRLRPAPTALPMLDLVSGERWIATPSALWRDSLATLWRLIAPGQATIGDRLGRLSQYGRFWEPLALAIMNLPAEDASARVFRAVLARTLWRGAAAAQSFLARHDLADTFITPGLDTLAKQGVDIRFGRRLRALERTHDGRVETLQFDDETVRVGPSDAVVLAVPWFIARDLIPSLPELPASPIVNAHFRLARPVPDSVLGLLRAHGQWLFGRGDVLSVTISGAASLVDRSADDIAGLLWPEVAKALDLTDAPVAVRVIKEKRATLLHTPAVEALRPQPRLGPNLVLAGDWTATGLPCTIEGALVSGRRAAALTLGAAR